MSNCTIVWYKCSDATIVTWCHNSTIWCHNSSTMAIINRKYTWLHFLLLPHSGYCIWGNENWLEQMSCWWRRLVLYYKGIKGWDIYFFSFFCRGRETRLFLIIGERVNICCRCSYSWGRIKKYFCGEGEGGGNLLRNYLQLCEWQLISAFKS